MIDELNVFGSWHDLVDALRPKSLKGKRVKKWKARVRRNRGMRTRAHKRELLRDRAKFVRTVVEGSANRSRPNAPKLDRPHLMARGRWFELLVAMGEAEWTMAALCVVYERDMPTTQATVKRFMMDRGLVEKRANPNTERYLVTGGHMAGLCTRPGKNRWLFRRTERGHLVAAGAEWRKPYVHKVHKYLRLRQAKASLAQGLIPDEA